MKKFLLLSALFLASTLVSLAQMSDQQVMNFIQQEVQAGTSQAQIVTKLMQKGVKIEQIRRIRQQYDKQLKQRGVSSQADAAVSNVESRMRTNDTGTGKGKNTRKTGVDRQERDDADFYQETDVQYDEMQMQQDINDRDEGRMGPDSLKVFGRDIFNNKLLSFEPNMNIATPQNYVLGPGDEVIVDIYGASQKSEQLTVSPDGEIIVPGFGPIHVAGLSVASAQSKIRSTLGSRYASSSLKLTVGQTRSIMVNVMGEVKVPGTYTLSAFATVFHALYMAGGINDLGTLRDIKVYRGGKLITVVDVYEYILNGRLAGNIRLHENDVIVVGPYECLVGIQGNVKRPMFYEMRPTESVAQVIKYAGGFTGDAYKKAVRLVRKSGERYSVHTVEEFDMSSFKLTDGDNITVDGMIERYENMVEVRGAVFRPGQFELGKQITTVRSLIENAGGLTEDAFTARGVLYRMKEDRTLETQSIDIAAIMDGTEADVPLRNEDVLFVATQSDRMAERTLEITGEVMSPGIFEYAENTTIEDLIIMAGGLTDQASLAKVDVSRRIMDAQATSKVREIAKTFTFSLKDGLVMDGGAGFRLEPYDVVHVRRSPAYSKARNISIIGEVNYEGSFTLPSKNMRLSDAIKMAGGITEEAYTRGARLVRQMNEEERARSEAVQKAIRNVLTDRGDSIDWKNISDGNTYIVGIQLDEALKNPGGDKDIFLRENDSIFVPEYMGTVKVSGDVFYPNTVSYTSGKDYKYYVNQAGGFGNRAKKSKAFIVYQNGTVAVVSKGAKPEPGCEIVIPSKKRREPFSLAALASVASSLTGIAALVLAISRL